MDRWSAAGKPLEINRLRTNDCAQIAGPAFPSALMPWLAVEQFQYERVQEQRAVLRLLATLGDGLAVPPGATLVVRHPGASSVHPPFVSRTSSSQSCECRGESPGGLLWRASFAMSLKVVEYPEAVFSLFADGRVPIALPSPVLTSAGPGVARHRRRLSGARVSRHLIALATGFAVAAAPGSAAAVASAATVKQAASGPLPLSSAATPHQLAVAPKHSSRAARRHKDAVSTSGTTTANPLRTRSRHAHTTSSAPAAGQSPSANHSSSTSEANSHHGKRRHRHKTGHGHHHVHQGGKTTPSLGTRPNPGIHHRIRPDVDHHKSPTRHHGSSLTHRHTTGDVTPAPAPSPAPTGPAPVITQELTAPVTLANTADASNPATIAAWLGLPAASSPSSAGLNVLPFTGSDLSQTSSLLATGDKPPASLIPIYKAAAKRYHVPWQILAAINWIETDFGQNMSTSSAGAIGWMQFMPGTWQQYGIAADGHGQPNPYNPQDAIFSAARYLAANGAAQNLPRAIYAYNHAAWYVLEVMWRAQIISDHSDAGANMALAHKGQTGLAGAETMLVAAYAAVGGPYSQANHDSFGQTAADLRRAGTDCSGFVSWVLDQVDPSFGNETTVTLPGQPGILPGIGQYVTMWDRPLPGDQGHVIINILGTWFESGGNTAFNPAGGIAPMTEAEAVGELTGGGFLPYHLDRL